MSSITVTVADGSERELDAGATVADLAASIGPRLAKDAVAAEVNGKLVDLRSAVHSGDGVKVVTGDSDEGRTVIRHSTAHVMAQAVLRLFPGAHFAIGPAIADGFYYDFELPGGRHFSDEDLPVIDAEMRTIVAEGQPFVREEHSIKEGLAIFADQPLKKEIIEEVAASDGSVDPELATEAPAGTSMISTYRNSATFVDLCRGPHVPSTDRLGHFMLTRVAGSYWRGDERRPQLQRIYGTAWESDAALHAYLRQLEEAERRDHRRFGAELDLFHFPPEIGSGLPVFHPKGALIRQVMEDYSRQMHRAHGYEQVWTPHISKSTLFETSGHLGWYAPNMYPPMEMEGATYYLKPMNCPMHILIYKDRSRSYRDLPMRLYEFATVYRFERSGVIHGLTRVRGLTQDDAHIFCTSEQLSEELRSLLAFVLEVLRAFGLTEFEAELATRPDEFVGDPVEWDEATAALRDAIEATGLPYVVAEGEGAFYAPKIDVHIRDAVGRRWQLSTIQVDFQLPARFDLTYVGADNERHRPRMIHRALFGSVERFFGILLEHYAGALPTWLMPVQARVLPVRDASSEYARKVAEALRDAQVRVDVDEAAEPLGARVRRAKLEKIPYVVVVGDDDVAHGTVGVNRRGADRPDRAVPLEVFLGSIVEEIATRGRPEDEAA
ncbi:MAG: threonine--tRNA ligase [Acidimicrobiales bacterium]